MDDVDEAASADGSQSGFATLRVPALCVPTSLDLEDGGDEPVAASAIGRRVLYPASSLSRACFNRSASLFPPTAGTSAGQEQLGGGRGEAGGDLALAHSACESTGSVPGVESSAVEAAGPIEQPLVLRQDDIPSQQGAAALDAAYTLACAAQRVGTRASTGGGAAPAGGDAQGSAGTSSVAGRAHSPEPDSYESDFETEADSPQQLAESAGSADTSRSPSRLGQYAAAEPSRPTTATTRQRQKPSLESRIAQQMARHTSAWSVTEVADWAEYIGLGQYRKRIVHHAINGELLLRLTSEQLKVEIGIGPLGHREGLLRAIKDLEAHYGRPGSGGSRYGDGGSQDEDWEGSMGVGRGSSQCGSPMHGRAADMRVLRAYEQRQRLVKDLEKAEAREAHRKKVAEDAARTLDLASEEVRKLRAAIADLDRSMGWGGGAAAEAEPLDSRGKLPWHPVGKFSRPATSPARQEQPPGSPQMSRMSRRIMEGQATSFLERLQTDIASRQAKLAEAAHRHSYAARGVAAEREQEGRDLKYIRELVAGKSAEVDEMLGSDEAARVEEALDDVAEMYQHDLGLEEEQVAAVKRARGVAAKASKLAGYVRTALFMDRLQQDLATRDSRLKELQKQWLLLEGGRNPAQQEAHDAEEARRMFALLGWPEEELEVKPGESSAAADALLGALLARVGALRRAAEAGKQVDWGLFRKDGLADLQERKIGQLQAALDEQKRQQQQEEARRQADARAGKKQTFRVKPPPELPEAKNYLEEAVCLLARCRADEIEMLEMLGGFRKLVMVYRAVRAMRFVEFTRADLQQRKAKAEQLASKVYPANRKVLSKEHFESFFNRLMEDTQRRMANKAEIAERARQEALAKLAQRTLPAPARRRPQSAHV